MNLSSKLQDLINRIPPLDEKAMQAAQERQDRLTKPRGSLGRLEELSILTAGITGQPQPLIEHKVVVVMAGDHGVAIEGVSAYPQEVTTQMVANFLAGGAAINALSRQMGARVVVVDMGVAAELTFHPSLIEAKIAPGTDNIAAGPAMSEAQALQALLAGARIAEDEMTRGLDILATGDMGIGNTTPSAAMACAFTGLPPEQVVGRGTGIDDRGLARKIEVVKKALAVNRPNPQDGLGVLAKVGGFEIAGLAGAILACAAARRPVVIDGYISTAAAMAAVKMAPRARHSLIAAHTSQETGHARMLEWLQLRPLLDLDMRLGEGTGAVLAMGLVEAACRTMAEMATFDQAGVSGKGE
jgi:nicotinate-nucleotide--dimethylbenzimidazole phosphoribosyltransferase